MKYVVWVKEFGKWELNGEGPLTLKQAERIARETRRDCGVPTRVLPEGEVPTERREPRPVDEPSDLDQNNPTDVSADTWRELYAKNPDLMDYDQEP
jgi:hypothetical protein